MTMNTLFFDPHEHAPIDSSTASLTQHLIIEDLHQSLDYSHWIEGVDKMIVRELVEALFLFRHHACQIDKRMYLFDGNRPTLSGYDLLSEHLFDEHHAVTLLQTNTVDINASHLRRVLNNLEALIINESAFRQLMGDPDVCQVQCHWYTSEYLFIYIN